MAVTVLYYRNCFAISIIEKLSWNFKHIVNVKTIRGIRAIANLDAFKPIEILSPPALLESEG